MKKIIAILALILCALTAFNSCSTTLVPHANGFYNEKEDVYYTYASMCYEAVGFKSEAYIKDDVGFEYHIVVGGNGVEADPEHFLYDKTNKTLIYNSNTALPTLAELNPTEMHFTVDGSVSQTLTSENDAEKISAVLDICLNALCAQVKYSSSDA